MQDKATIQKHIARSILRRVEDAGYQNIEQFCLANELVKTTVYRAANLKTSPRISTLIDIASALDISLKDLLDLEHINIKTNKSPTVKPDKLITARTK